MNEVMKNFEIALAEKSQIKKFDFGSYELTQIEISNVSLLEKEFLNSFRKYKNNMYSMCSSLAEIEKILKKDGIFMQWYESVGLTKDNVSVLLKRWNLFCEFSEYRDKIFSYSDQAIKILTSKEILYDDVLSILNNDIYKAKEIKKILEPVAEKNKIDFRPAGQKYFNFNKIKRMKKRIKKLKTDEEKTEYKNELQEYIKGLQKLEAEL